MGHRIFLAVYPPTQIQIELKKVATLLSSLNLPIRLVTENNFHLTLKFFDNRIKKEIELIDNIIKEFCFNEKPFTLILKGVKIFPSLTNARVISVDFKASQRMKKLAEKINHRCNKLFFIIKENRVFKPHLTLARIKGFINPSDLKKIENISCIGNWPVNSLELLESNLAGLVPFYKTIQSYPLS